MISGEAAQMRYVQRYLHKVGRVIVAEVSRSPVRDAEGRTMYFIISERDITEEGSSRPNSLTWRGTIP